MFSPTEICLRVFPHGSLVQGFTGLLTRVQIKCGSQVSRTRRHPTTLEPLQKHWRPLLMSQSVFVQRPGRWKRGDGDLMDQHIGFPTGCRNMSAPSLCRLRPGLQRTDGGSRVPGVLWLCVCPCWDEMHHDRRNCPEQSPAGVLRWCQLHLKRWAHTGPHMVWVQSSGPIPESGRTHTWKSCRTRVRLPPHPLTVLTRRNLNQRARVQLPLTQLRLRIHSLVSAH